MRGLAYFEDTQRNRVIALRATKRNVNRTTILFIACFIGMALRLSAAGSDSVSYQKQVRRILSNHCYQCHGPDAETREAKLRLDLEQGAIVELGGAAISRDEPDESELLARIEASDPDDVMPPPEINKPLTADQKAILKRWIQEGANWNDHWAYSPATRPVPPRKAGRSVHPIDQFIRARLTEEGVEPSAEADAVTLVRRLHFDLIGMPPLRAEVDAYLNDESSVAYENMVDRLLESDHFGERLAMYWFDLVRFGSTSGIHADNPWHVTPYRNWVIDALNDNLPFDQFTREQLAGDLLPDSTTDTKIAATYNRLNLSTREGGSQAKEFIAKYMADRIRNVSSVWLASTMGCAECHDHKFDPISTREFYQFGAFFSDIEQVGVYGADFPPYLKLPTDDQRVELEVLTAGIERLQSVINGDTPELLAAKASWEEELLNHAVNVPEMTAWHSIGPFGAGSFEAAFDAQFAPEKNIDLAAVIGEEQLAWREQPQWTDGEIHALQGDNSATYLFREIKSPTERELTLSFGSDDGLIVWLNGEEALRKKVNRGVAKDQDKVTVKLNAGGNRLLLKIVNGGGGSGFFFRANAAPAPENILQILKVAEADRNEKQTEELDKYFRSITPLLEAERNKLVELEKRHKELDDSLLKTLATVAVEPAMTRVLPRGNWMDDSGEVVKPGVPAAMGGTFSTNGERGTRLDLANWLVQKENPLTARVFVNRLWMLFYGEGLSKSVDDFGAQGESPSHPELLDWLATEFVDSGWDIKHMVRLMVSSDTYKQSSLPRPESQRRDPFNRLFARQNRFRVDAEMVRDVALRTSGLLNAKVGGDDAAHPYQPGGYYRHLNFPTREYKADENENQYRRGVYMHWQRQYLHPALQAFDAPTREECVAKRPRSNTPLAALVQMNDPTVIEAARALAELVLTTGHGNEQDRLTWCFERVLSREPNAEEIAILNQLLDQQRTEFAAAPEHAGSFLDVGLKKRNADLNATELAAWTMVSRTLLNTHEAILRQ